MRRARKGESGFTIVEMLVAIVIALVAMAGFLAFLEAITRSSANDQERNVSLVEQTAAIHRIAQELGETYKVNEPAKVEEATKAIETNYIDVYAWLTPTGSSQQKRRLVVNCEEATSIPNEQKCVTYETATTDATPRENMKTDKSAKKRIDILRLDDGTKTAKVFKLTDPSGTGNGRPTYGQITVETPASGERVTVKNTHLYSYQVLLKDSFYMRNLDFGQ